MTKILEVSLDHGQTWVATEEAMFRVMDSSSGMLGPEFVGRLTASSVWVQDDPYGEEHSIKFEEL